MGTSELGRLWRGNRKDSAVDVADIDACAEEGRAFAPLLQVGSITHINNYELIFLSHQTLMSLLSIIIYLPLISNTHSLYFFPYLQEQLDTPWNDFVSLFCFVF
jgi:hypothetical protein